MKLIPTLTEAFRIYNRARRFTGFKKYDGTPKQICKKIIKDCYNPLEHFFQVSNGHFCEFYVRDFAFCCEALVQLGYGKHVRNTIRYAFEKFTQYDRIATMITPKGVPYDFPSYGPDSLALFLYTITHTKSHAVAKKYKKFLQEQVQFFADYVVDKKTLLPRKWKHFSSIRDQTKRKASCYDATMVALVAKECETLGLDFPYSFSELRELLVTTYWNGSYFFNDLHKQAIVVGDANVFPFWTGVVTNETMRERTFASIQAAGLDRGMPLRYVSALDKKREKTRFNISGWLVPDYETDAVWAHLGFCYIRELGKVDKNKQRAHLRAYEKKIQRYRTFLEVYTNEGDPFRKRLYVTDEGMLWCCNWLALQ
ncbi:MAG: hypothetical protein OXR66_07485 [Candidatus Woesearchaeota archaeon]|nr:hypothetical protein [Candidatus Woesearchaeota archaeon]